MSFIYSQALVAAFLPGNCLATDAFAPLSGSLTPKPFSLPDRTTALFPLSRFGLTCKPLTEIHGAELLTAFLADFHAPISALPEKAQALTEKRAECGDTWAASLAKFDPVSCEWKTAQCLLLGGLGRVLGDLAAMGFDARWGVLGASDVGAPHKRERIWIVANARSGRRGESSQWQDQQLGRAEVIGTSDAMANAMREQSHRGWARPEQDGIAEPANGRGDVADADSLRKLQPEGYEQDIGRRAGNSGTQLAYADREREQRIVTSIADAQDGKESGERSDRPCGDGVGRWPVEPELGRVANGVANRSHRIKALGNGQVPRVAAAAWRLLA